MNESNIIYFCRVCLSKKIEKFNINHYGFPGKNENWKSFFCFDCGSVSDFRIKEDYISYTDGSFRNIDHFNIKSDDEKVLPPIDPWSAISFKRWSHVWKRLEKSSNIFSIKEIKMLDYGGYQGFLPYAFKQKHKINSYVADLDLKGLAMAQLLGSKTINLAESEIDENNFDLITIVHVLEHLDKPIENILKLKNILSENGVIYAEVPNLYGLPMVNEAHKISFSEYSFVNMFKSAGFEILDYGFTKSPKESIKFDYVYNYNSENIYVVCGNGEKKLLLNFPKDTVPKSIEKFKYELNVKYAKLMFKNISLTLLRPSLVYLRKSILYFIYGLVELITLKIFKISLISKYFPKKR
tara:strand:- start:3129 stop:4187 length:1059 start_codon:yes stop_codon:yes gene_type:complete